MNKSLWSLIVLFLLVVMATTLVVFNNGLWGSKAEEASRGAFRMGQRGDRVSYRETGRTGKRSASDEVAFLIDEALKNIEKNDINAAEDNIRTALVFDHENMRALTILGRILFVKEEYGQAEDVFRRQLELEPDNSTALNNLGSTLVRLNKLSEAINYTARSYELSPDSPEIMLNLAGLYSMTGDKKNAVALLRKVYKIIGSAMITLSSDESFDNIRNDPEFIELMTQVMNNSYKMEPRKP
jgi:Flp pilus assembly protein TadD